VQICSQIVNTTNMLTPNFLWARYGTEYNPHYLGNGVQTVPGGNQHSVISIDRHVDHGSQQLRDVVRVVGAGPLTERVKYHHGGPPLGRHGVRHHRRQQVVYHRTNSDLVGNRQHHGLTVFQLLRMQITRNIEWYGMV